MIMRKTRVGPPLSTHVMVFRSVVAALLLFGSLLPSGTLIQAGAAVAAVPLVVATLFRMFFERLYLHNALLVIIPVFGALLLPALFLPVVGEYGGEKLLDLATLSILTALAASIITDRDHLRIFAKTWIVLGLIVAVIALFGGSDGSDRATGAGANPIGLARCIAVAVVSTAWLMINERLKTMAGLAALTVLGLGIFATGSKGPVVGAGIACLIMVLANSDRRVLRLVQIGAAAVAVYVIVLLTPFLRESRLGQFMVDPLGVQDPIRDAALTATWNALAYEGFNGHGYGSWSHVTGYRIIEYPHNIWAELLIEAGWAPTLIVGVVLVLVLVRLIRNGSPSAQLAAAWLTAEAASASLSGDVRARAFWFFLVLGYLVLRWGLTTLPEPSSGSDGCGYKEHGKISGPQPRSHRAPPAGQSASAAPLALALMSS